MKERRSTLDRFYAKVDRSQGDEKCWPWVGGRDQDGYGVFWDGTYTDSGRGHQVRVTRWVYEQFVGPIPAGHQMLHTCDNPPCVNLRHLWTGTAKDNHGDREAKGRGRPSRGSSHKLAKLTEAQVVMIRQRAAAGEMQALLAAEFGVSDSLLSNIVHRNCWKHVA